MAWGLPSTTIRIPPYSSNCPLCGLFTTSGEYEGVYYGSCENCHVTANTETNEIIYWNPDYWEGKKKIQPWVYLVGKAFAEAAEEFKNE